MSVSPYSVQHDYEVHEYNKRRAAWKESEKKRRQEEKLLRDQAKRDRKAALKQLAEAERAEPRKTFGWLCRKSPSKTEVFAAKKLDDDSDSDEISLQAALAPKLGKRS